MTNETKPQPVERITTHYPVTAAIWKNVRKDDGKVFYSFTIDRRYKKNDSDEYESTNSFGVSHALLVAKVANMADSLIRKRYEEDRQAAKLDEAYQHDDSL